MILSKKGEAPGSGCLRQRPDALGAQKLLNFMPVLHDGHLLQVGPVDPVGDPVGERNIMTKGSGLTTMSAFCHYWTSFLAR